MKTYKIYTAEGKFVERVSGEITTISPDVIVVVDAKGTVAVLPVKAGFLILQDGGVQVS